MCPGLCICNSIPTNDTDRAILGNVAKQVVYAQLLWRVQKILPGPQINLLIPQHPSLQIFSLDKSSSSTRAARSRALIAQSPPPPLPPYPFL